MIVVLKNPLLVESFKSSYEYPPIAVPSRSPTVISTVAIATECSRDATNPVPAFLHRQQCKGVVFYVTVAIKVVLVLVGQFKEVKLKQGKQYVVRMLVHESSQQVQ